MERNLTNLKKPIGQKDVSKYNRYLTSIIVHPKEGPWN